MTHDTASQRVASGQIWDDFCDALKSAGLVIQRPGIPHGELDRAEGLRYLTRLTRIALEMMQEFSDPDFPVFYAASHDTVKIFAPNPDNAYLNATIAGDREYRLYGNRGTIPYLSFGTKANRYAIDGTMVSTGELDAADMEFGADGSFEAIASATPQPGNWLPVSGDSTMVLVRQTFGDRSTETPASVDIECIGRPPRPMPLSAAAADAGLAAAAAFVDNTARSLADISELFSRRPNELLAEPYAELSMRTGGDPNICYYHGFWQLDANQALVIDTAVPDCTYWNFQLNNYWMESLDYRYHPVAVNHVGARRNPDGSVTIVVGARDPGFGNFIDTAGHTNGTMLLRWVGASSHPRPHCRVAALADL